MWKRLGAALLLTAAVGCANDDPCPKGLKLVAAKSKPPGSLFCADTKSKKARWYGYYPTGQKQFECPYESRVAHGEFRSWHRGGGRWVEGRYEWGFKRGKWTQWSETGEKSAEGDYRDGQLVAGAPVGTAAACENQKL